MNAGKKYDLPVFVKVLGLLLSSGIFVAGLGIASSAEGGLAGFTVTLLLFPVLFTAWIVGEMLGPSVRSSFEESKEWREMPPILRIVVGVIVFTVFGAILTAVAFLIS